MLLFGFVTNPIVTITFDRQNDRQKCTNKSSGYIQQDLLVFASDEKVSGTIEVTAPNGKRIDHLGIKIELFGELDLHYDRSKNVKFLSLVRELEAAGALLGSQKYSFDFTPEKPYESYSGINASVRYFIRFTMSRSYGNNFTLEKPFVIYKYNQLELIGGGNANLQQEHKESNGGSNNNSTSLSGVLTTTTTTATTATNTPIKMEVGIEDCLHIEFEYDRNRYHVHDVIQGKINFILVRIKIKYMELTLIRREISGQENDYHHGSETVIKHELMDGSPVKGEIIPIRLYLSYYDLTPTYESIHNNYITVKYYLNIVLVDDDDRRYFKQQEVIFYRQNSDDNNIDKVYDI